MCASIKTGHPVRPLLFGLLFPVTLASVPLLAEESFFVAGPLERVVEYLPSDNDYQSFSATFWYEPQTPPSQVQSHSLFQSAYFGDAVTRVEFALLDGDGNVLAQVATDGLTAAFRETFIAVENDLSGTGADFIGYGFTAQSATSAIQALIEFSDPSGLLVDDVSATPAPPGNGMFAQTSVQLGHIEELVTTSETGRSQSQLAGFIALGTVTMVGGGDADPVDDCTQQTKNHGQFVSCIAHLNNLLRADGEISGREKGSRQRDAARKKK